MKQTRDISKLPKWGQAEITSLKDQLRLAHAELERIRTAHAVLQERDWFVINSHFRDSMHLWLLDKDQPFSLCHLGPGDVLLVGRAIKTPVWVDLIEKAKDDVAREEKQAAQAAEDYGETRR